MTSFSSRFLAEFRLPIFSLHDTNGKAIDLKESFAPSSKIVCGIKFLLVLFAISGVIIDITGDPDPDFWIAYLTHWGEIFGTAYLLLSFISAVGWIPVIILEDTREGEKVSATIWTEIVWGLFPGIMTVQMIIVAMFWLTVYKGETKTYEIIFGHGLLLLAIALDGHVLNRTPIRVKQIAFVYLIAIAYTIWTLIHGLATNIGNPDHVNTGADDDAIYGIINWSARPLTTFITVAIVYVVVAPLFFAICWGLSIGVPRRYLSKEKEEADDVVNITTSLL
jgi:hypothetical protein